MSLIARRNIKKPPGYFSWRDEKVRDGYRSIFTVFLLSG